MLSCSHWGMFWLPQAKYSKAWYDEQRTAYMRTHAGLEFMTVCPSHTGSTHPTAYEGARE
jgi:hypothetical protein